MTGTLTDRTVLTQAADLIEQRGKAVGEYEDDRYRVCTLGAISYVIYGDPITADSDIGRQYGTPEQRAIYVETCLLLEKHLIEAKDPTWPDTQSLSRWSDRSQQEHVVAALRAAAGVGEPS